MTIPHLLDYNITTGKYLTPFYNTRKEKSMNIGENVRRIRIEKGMTQEELAEKVNVSHPTICRLETGVKIPSVMLCFEISKVLGCSISDIIKED